MGYRSEVAFEISGPAEVMINGLASIRLTTDPQIWTENIKHLQFKEDGDKISILFAVEDWKWYEDYKDVRFLSGIYDYFDDLEHENVWGYFARVGEDREDVEERNFGDYQWDGAIEIVPATLHVSDGEYKYEIPRIKSSAAGKDNPQSSE